MRRWIVVACVSSAFAASALGIGGCFGTETGNPPFAPELGAGGYEPTGIAPDHTLETARVVVEEATLEDCDGARYPLFRGGVLDFAAQSASFAEALEIPAGAYCAIELLIAACEDPDRCRTVLPDAVTADGTRASDGARFELRDATVIDVRLEGDAFDVGPDAGGLLIALDRTTMLAPIDLGTLTPSGGVIRVDATTNADRLPALRDGLRTSLTLRRDLDGDATLDREELEVAPLAEPAGAPAP